MRYRTLTILFIGMLCTLEACYTFKGTSIPPGVETFYIAEVINLADNSPVDLGNTFRQSLIDKIRNESRLAYSDLDPDLEFHTQIQSFDVSSEAPQNNNEPAYNKLTIRISVEYLDLKNEKNNFEETFSFFDTYPSQASLNTVQDALIEAIFEDITEKVFNKAFTNW